MDLAAIREISQGTEKTSTENSASTITECPVPLRNEVTFDGPLHRDCKGIPILGMRLGQQYFKSIPFLLHGYLSNYLG